MYCSEVQPLTSAADRKLGCVDVDDGGVGRAEFFAMGEGFSIDFFGEGEAVAAGFAEADELFKPGGSGGLEMDAGVEAV